MHNAECRMRWAIRDVQYAICLCALFLFTACGVTPPPANGWAIVAADPKTGDVGVAGASCSEYPFDYRASLVPNKGALAQLGVSSPLQRDRASAWMQAPMDARTIARRISNVQNDPEAAKRVWGIVTLANGQAQSDTFLGLGNADQAGTAENSSGAIVVVGAGMANGNVPERSVLAFQEDEAVRLPLSDRLMRALEAGSAAGGIAMCNQNGVTQTASTAFVMMARGGGPSFQVSTLGNTASQEPHPPVLALSVSEPIGGRNAVASLREQYNAWRQAHLPECAECLQTRGVLPAGGALTTPRDAWLTQNALWLVIAFVGLVMPLTIAYFVMRPQR